MKNQMQMLRLLISSFDQDKVRSMFEAIKSDEIGLGSIDFNKVIPTPNNIYMFRDGGKMFRSLTIEHFTPVPNYS